MMPSDAAGQTERAAGRQLRHRLKRLEEQFAALEKQAGELRARLARLGPTDRRRRSAVVDRSRCTGCGLCEELCPVRAIRVTYVAHVDAGRCTGCGTCTQSCPQGAIHLATAATTPAVEADSA